MNFEQAHRQFIEHHLSRRTGERRGRLERGHAHGEKAFLEKVWWALKGDFGGLHPEYELLDWRSRPFYPDFVYFSKSSILKLVIEIKGYTKHIQEMDRQGHGNSCKRELFFEGVGYRVVSVSYDDIRDQPELIVALLRMLLSQYESEQPIARTISFAANETIRLALSRGRKVRPLDVQNALGMTHRRAVKELRQLCESGWFRPETGKEGKRVVNYVLVRDPLK